MFKVKKLATLALLLTAVSVPVLAGPAYASDGPKNDGPKNEKEAAVCRSLLGMLMPSISEAACIVRKDG